MIIKPIFEPISLSLQQQQDIALLKDGAPSLLLMMDGFIAANPDNTDLLLEGARSYAAYATALNEFNEKNRAAIVSNRSKEYGLRLLQSLPGIQDTLHQPLPEFTKSLSAIKSKDINILFWGAYCWATWIGLQNGSPAAVAALPKVEQIMLRVIELDESYYYGAAHVFLGYYYGAIPAMYGGRPEKSRDHFERALEISNRNFLSVQVAYAETYAKLQFDRTLFERLLTEVLAKPVDILPELTAGNQMAKIRAQRLLDSIDEYF